jgi:hypothetical protein
LRCVCLAHDQVFGTAPIGGGRTAQSGVGFSAGDRSGRDPRGGMPAAGMSSPAAMITYSGGWPVRSWGSRRARGGVLSPPVPKVRRLFVPVEGQDAGRNGNGSKSVDAFQEFFGTTERDRVVTRRIGFWALVFPGGFGGRGGHMTCVMSTREEWWTAGPVRPTSHTTPGDCRRRGGGGARGH